MPFMDSMRFAIVHHRTCSGQEDFSPETNRRGAFGLIIGSCYHQPMKSLRQIAAMFSPLGWTILAITALSIVLAVFILITGPQRARSEAAKAKAGVVVAQGEKKASTDAISVVVGNQERSEETQDTRRENEVAIRQAEGASDEVNPAVAAAGRNGLCKYRAYRDRPECVRNPNP